MGTTKKTPEQTLQAMFWQQEKQLQVMSDTFAEVANCFIQATNLLDQYDSYLPADKGVGKRGERLMKKLSPTAKHIVDDIVKIDKDIELYHMKLRAYNKLSEQERKALGVTKPKKPAALREAEKTT